MASEEIYEFIKHRLVSIRSVADDRLLGSGVIVSRSGYVLTCSHVIPDNEEIYIKFSENTQIPIESIKRSGSIDVALVKCMTPKEPFPFFVLSATVPELDRDVMVGGFVDKPHISAYVRKESIASKITLREEMFAADVFGLSGTGRGGFSAGMSGGPVIDPTTKELIGLILGYDKSLAKNQFDLEKKLSGFQLNREEDLIIPVSLILTHLTIIEDVALVNRDDAHRSLIDRITDVLDLLGFQSEVIRLEPDHNYYIHSRIRIGFVPFNCLFACVTKTGANSFTEPFLAILNKFPALALKISEPVDKLCIVTELPFSDSDERLARERNITLIGTEELFARLIDFSEYLRWGIQQWTNDSNKISEHYIDLRAHHLEGGIATPIDSVDNFLDRWLAQSNKSKLLVLGRFGSGKTTICRNRLFKLASDYVDSGNRGLVPILIRLIDARVSSLRQVMNDVTEQAIGHSYATPKVLTRLNEMGRLVMIFDGFDEMAQSGIRSEPFKNMREVSKYFAIGSKAIITSRLEYFVEGKDIQDLMSISEFEVLRTTEHFDILVLDDLTPEQIKDYIEKSSSNSETKLVTDALRDRPNLADLSRRPALLNIIAQTLPALLEKSKSVTAASLYQEYMDQWLARDIKTGRTYLPKEQKLDLMRSIASVMHSRGQLTIEYEELAEYIAAYFDGDTSRVYFYLHDLLTNSFLTRNNRDKTYEFSHKSIFEFFLAQSLLKEIEESVRLGNLNAHIFSLRRLSYEVIIFLRDLGVRVPDLVQLILGTKGRTMQEVGFQGGNAVTALKHHQFDFRGKDFSNTILAGALFSDIDISGCSLRNSLLYDASFVNSVLDDVDMSHADLTRADLKTGRVIYSLAYSEELNVIVSDNSASRLVSIWWLDDKYQLAEKLSLKGHLDDVFRTVISPDGSLVASAGQDQTIRLWDIQSGREIGVLRRHVGDVRNLVFFDNRTLISAGMDGQMNKWDVVQKEVSDSVRSGFEFWGLAANASKGLLATGDINGKLVIWRSDNLEKLKEHWVNKGQARDTKFYPNSNLLLTGCIDGSIFMWDYEDDSWRNVNQQSSPIKSLAVRSDGLVASGADDGSIALWGDVQMRHIRTFHAHNDYVSDIAFSSVSTNLMLSASPDGTIAIWDLTNKKLIRQFTEEFFNNKFSCRGLKLTGVTNLPVDRLLHLKKLGAISA